MFDLEEIGKRIKTVRAEKEMSLDDIANEIGVAKSTIQRYESGKIRSPKIPVLNAIANALEVNPAWLLGTSDQKVVQNSVRAIRIPVLGRIAAGIPINAITEIIDWEEVRPDDVAGGEYFALQIRGDSMEPRIRNGDVIICRQQEDAEDGALVVAMVNGDDACCKKLKKYPNGAIGLMSTNPAYEPMIFTLDEIDERPVRIIGIVKELRAKF